MLVIAFVSHLNLYLFINKGACIGGMGWCVLKITNYTIQSNTNGSMYEWQQALDFPYDDSREKKENLLDTRRSTGVRECFRPYIHRSLSAARIARRRNTLVFSNKMCLKTSFFLLSVSSLSFPHTLTLLALLFVSERTFATHRTVIDHAKTAVAACNRECAGIFIFYYFSCINVFIINGIQSPPLSWCVYVCVLMEQIVGSFRSRLCVHSALRLGLFSLYLSSWLTKCAYNSVFNVYGQHVYYVNSHSTIVVFICVFGGKQHFMCNALTTNSQQQSTVCVCVCVCMSPYLLLSPYLWCWCPCSCACMTVSFVRVYKCGFEWVSFYTRGWAPHTAHRHIFSFV